MIGPIGMNMHPRTQKRDDCHKGQKCCEDSDLSVHVSWRPWCIQDSIAPNLKLINFND